jgi:adenine phosphoribosyltransferase
MTDNDDLKALIRTIPNFPKPGVQFRDVSTLLMDGPGFRNAINRIAKHVPADTALVAGVEARGFIVAAALGYALTLGKIMLRKKGKLPGDVVGLNYALEYGEDRLEMHRGAVQPGQHVVLVDDLIATGGTAMASVELLRSQGAVVEHALFIVDLPDLGGAERLRKAGVKPISLMAFAGD